MSECIETTHKEIEQILNDLYYKKIVSFRIKENMISKISKKINSEIKSDKQLMKKIADKTVELTIQSIERTNVSMKVFKALEKVDDEIITDDKTKIIKKMMKFLDKSFNLNVKKRAIKYILKNDHSAETAENLIIKKYSIIDEEDLRTILLRIPEWKNNNQVIKSLDKSKAYIKEKYNYITLNDNNEERRKFLKSCCKNWSLTKSLNQHVKVTYDDLAEIPSCMRMKLLIKILFGNNSYRERYGYKYLTAQEILIEMLQNNNNLYLDNSISEEKINKLLFSISLKNNDRVSNFFENFLILKSNQSEMRKILEKINCYI